MWTPTLSSLTRLLNQRPPARQQLLALRQGQLISPNSYTGRLSNRAGSLRTPTSQESTLSIKCPIKRPPSKQTWTMAWQPEPTSSRDSPINRQPKIARYSRTMEVRWCLMRDRVLLAHATLCRPLLLWRRVLSSLRMYS
jgi:hypothetical protein